MPILMYQMPKSNYIFTSYVYSIDDSYNEVSIEQIQLWNGGFNIIGFL